MGGERLYDWLGRIHFDGGCARRSDRREARLHRGICPVYQVGWRNGFVEISSVLVLIFGAAFIFQERRCAQPMLPLELFSQRPFLLSSVVGLRVNIAFYGLIFVLSLYIQKQNGLSPLDRAGVRAHDGRGIAVQYPGTTLERAVRRGARHRSGRHDRGRGGGGP